MSQKLKSRHPNSSIRSEAGLLTVDFLFGITIAMSLGILFFAFSFTLSMIEVAQYIAFSSARAMAAAAEDPQTQARAASDKYKELVNNPSLKPILGNPDGPFFMLKAPDVRNGYEGNSFVSNYDAGTVSNRVPQVGVTMEMEVKILNLKLVFIGPTARSGESYTTKVTGLIFREPSSEECVTQIKSRYKAINKLDTRFTALGNTGEGIYSSQIAEDNGC